MPGKGKFIPLGCVLRYRYSMTSGHLPVGLCTNKARETHSVLPVHLLIEPRSSKPLILSHNTCSGTPTVCMALQLNGIKSGINSNLGVEWEPLVELCTFLLGNRSIAKMLTMLILKICLYHTKHTAVHR